MYIQTAVKLAMKNSKYIARTDSEPFISGLIKLKPTNTSDCVIIIHCSPRRDGPRWNPTADDLISDKWTVVD